ncbi:MAG: hypothetical protein RIQ60_4008 [Pseudomonadota bacterium]
MRELPVVAAMDVPRFMGRWYEIALLPNVFQRQCTSDTRADYRLLPGGQVEVINSCRKADGELIQALGQARQLGAATSPRLEVRFAPQWLSLLPWVWGDYWVIDLDVDYQLAAVGSPSRQFLWILSRQPEVDARAYDALIARVAALGFDVSALRRTPHLAAR